MTGRPVLQAIAGAAVSAAAVVMVVAASAGAWLALALAWTGVVLIGVAARR